VEYSLPRSASNVKRLYSAAAVKIYTAVPRIYSCGKKCLQLWDQFGTAVDFAAGRERGLRKKRLQKRKHANDDGCSNVVDYSPGPGVALWTKARTHITCLRACDTRHSFGGGSATSGTTSSPEAAADRDSIWKAWCVRRHCPDFSTRGHAGRGWAGRVRGLGVVASPQPGGAVIVYVGTSNLHSEIISLLCDILLTLTMTPGRSIFID
jgi:hypothetical protein